jgi:hypothetical protein
LLTVSYKKPLGKLFALSLLTIIYKKLLAKVYAKNLIYPISSITFAPIDCPSHRSFISIQRSKIKIKKQKTHESPIPFHLFSYIKREMRERQRREIRKK